MLKGLINSGSVSLRGGRGLGYIMPGAFLELAVWRGDGEGRWLLWLKECKGEGFVTCSGCVKYRRRSNQR